MIFFIVQCCMICVKKKQCDKNDKIVQNDVENEKKIYLIKKMKKTLKNMKMINLIYDLKN